jgi:hypothetical protein
LWLARKDCSMLSSFRLREGMAATEAGFLSTGAIPPLSLNQP